MSDFAAKGCISILVGPNGHVWGVGHDFEDGGAAGFSRKERNRMRSQSRMANDFARNALSSAVLPAFDTYDAENLMHRLCGKGWKIHDHYIGYEDEK